LSKNFAKLHSPIWIIFSHSMEQMRMIWLQLKLVKHPLNGCS
jgi:hypothetical protein